MNDIEKDKIYEDKRKTKHILNFFIVYPSLSLNYNYCTTQGKNDFKPKTRHISSRLSTQNFFFENFYCCLSLLVRKLLFTYCTVYWSICFVWFEPETNNLASLVLSAKLPFYLAVPPDIEERSSSSDVTVREGANTTLTCVANGLPLPKVSRTKALFKMLQTPNCRTCRHK